MKRNQTHSISDSINNSTIENATYTKVTWRLIPILFLCYVASYLDRVNVGFAKLNMLSDLGFSETVYGLGAGIFFIGYFIFEIPSNILLHKIGARIWMARIMITWGIISGLMIFVDSAPMFYAMRFALGVAEAGFFPGVILYLTYWYPAKRRGKIIAIFMTAVAVSGVIGGPLSGWIMNFMPGLYGLAGWQWMFIIEAIPSIILGIALIFYLQDRIEDAHWLSFEEKQLLTKNILADANTKNRNKFYASNSTPQNMGYDINLLQFCDGIIWHKLLASHHHQSKWRFRYLYYWITYSYPLCSRCDKHGNSRT